MRLEEISRAILSLGQYSASVPSIHDTGSDRGLDNLRAEPHTESLAYRDPLDTRSPRIQVPPVLRGVCRRQRLESFLE